MRSKLRTIDKPKAKGAKQVREHGETLRQSETKFRALSEQLPLGVSIIGSDGIYEYINPKFSEISGYTLQDFHNGKEWFRLAFPDVQYRKRLISGWLGDLREKSVGEIRPRIFTITCKDGTEKIIHLRAVSTPEGKQICSWEDITEQEQTEEALRSERDKLQGVLSAIDAGVDIINQDFVIEYQNRFLVQRFGDRRGEKCYIAYMHLDKPCEFCRIHEAMKTGKMQHVELTGGDGRDYELTSSSFIDTDGETKVIEVVRDITERKRAETELKETKDRLSEIVDDIAIPAFAIDKEHRLTNWNTALEALSDVKRGDVVGTSKQWLAFYSYERPVVADLIVDGASEDEIKKYYRGKYKKSSLIEGAYEAEDFFSELGEDGKWLHFTAAPIKGEAGEVVAAIETLEDITGRKQAEQFSEVLLHSVGVAVFIIQDGKIQYVNPMFLEQSGYTNEEIIGTYSLDLVHPEDRELVRKKAIEHLKERSALLYEYRFLRKDGETMWVLERVVPTQYRGKLAVIGYFVDITERKQAEERLKLLSDALEASVDGIAVADMEGNIAFSNKALCQMWGYSPDELSHMKTARLYVRSELGRLLNEIAPQIIAGGWTGELTGLRKDGSEFPLTCSCAPIYDEQGQAVFLIAVYRDITEQRKAEEQLAVTSRLASIGEMVSGVAHEINNPLTGILGYAQLLQEEDIPENIKKDLGKISSEAKRTAKIVQNLLSFARQYKLEKVPTDINDVINRTLELRNYELKVNNIQVKTEFQADLPLVLTDSHQLIQVFLNLIVNAESAMVEAHGKGMLTVTTRGSDGKIEISFADNGPGIPKESLDKVFDPFFTTKEVGKGTGLGLSICHGIVTGLGGSIYAKSKLGRGATFIVELPIVTEVKQLRLNEMVGREPRELGGANILVVDNEPAVCEIVSRVLSKGGCKVDIANSAEMALRELGIKDYDLCLVDLKMPKMDGRELYEAIKRRYPGMAGKVVFVTGDTVTKATQHFLEQTGRPHIAKPFDVSKLKNLISGALKA